MRRNAGLYRMSNFGFLVKLCLPCLFLLIAALSGCTDKETEPVPTPTAAPKPQVTVTPAFTVPEPSTVYVEIKGSMFNPPVLKVINGTTVRWTNMDSAAYVINVDNVSSPPIHKRETWNYTFNKTGTFEYNCSLHPTMPKGRVIVEIFKFLKYW